MSLYKQIKSKKEKIAIVGLGYVGLPLAVEFGKIVDTIGFDLNKRRILFLKKSIDTNKEISPSEIKLAAKLKVTADVKKLKEAKF
ncbi:MAG: nucleotide sugar dehydrogenase, partial [Candidatus Omnitrophota bacterium]